MALLTSYILLCTKWRENKARMFVSNNDENIFITMRSFFIQMYHLTFESNGKRTNSERSKLIAKYLVALNEFENDKNLVSCVSINERKKVLLLWFLAAVF